MPVYNTNQGTRTASLLTAGTLASATYIAGSAVDLGADIPIYITFEVEANANGTPSGNKQLVLFLKWSLDGTNYQSGPESGTTATEEADLDHAGSLPMNDTNDHRKFFIVYPKGRYFQPILKNDLGVALTSGAVYRSDWTGPSA